MQIRHGDTQRRRRGVHRKIETRFDNGGCNQRHNRHKGFHQHSAVTDITGIGFTGQQFRCGTGSNQGVEAGNRTTGNSNKQEREQSTFPDRTGSVNELCHCRHFQIRVEDNDTHSQTDDNTDFQEGCQIVTRSQNQPHRQQSGNKRIADQGISDSGIFKGQRRAPVRVVCNHTTEPDSRHQQHNTDDRHFTDTSRPEIAHVDPHKQGNRHSGYDGEHTPRTFCQRFHHNQCQHGEDDDHNQEAAEERDSARHGSHLFFNNLTQRCTITARGDKQHHKVLYRPRQHHTGQQPECARQIPHLRGKYRSD